MMLEVGKVKLKVYYAKNSKKNYKDMEEIKKLTLEIEQRRQAKE